MTGGTDGPAEQLLVGDIVTMADDLPRAEALAVRGDRVVAVGSVDQARAALSPGVPARTVPGWVVPGLIDSHSHLYFASLNLGRLDIRDVTSAAELLARVRAYAAEHPEPWWIDGRFDVDATELAEGRLPSAAELDEATGGRPLRLNRGGHQVLVNAVALRHLAPDRLTAEFGPESVERDAAGRPTGVLSGRGAFLHTDRVIPPPDATRRAAGLVDMQARYHANGITGVTEPGLTRDHMAVYEQCDAEGTLTMRTRLLALANSTLGPGELTADLAANLAALRHHVDERGAGSRLSVGGVKAFLDGGASMGTALLEQSWPGRPDYHGELVFSTEQLAEIVDFCATESLPLGVHAVGGGAVRLALEAFQRGGRIAPLRFSVIHGYLWPSASSMALAAALGVAVASQPAMQWTFAQRLTGVFGDEAIGRAHPFRSWLDSGVLVAGGSDHPAIPLSPFLAMASARSRRIKGRGEPLGTGEAITAVEALRLYTRSSAWLAFAEHRRGHLAAGTDADWAVLDVDPLRAPADELAQAGVVETVVAGQQVHST